MSGPEGPGEDASREEGPAPQPRASRQRRLLRFLRAGTVAVFLLAVGGFVLPEPASTTSATLMVAVLVAVPAVRVGWLVQRWFRRGDRRYGLVALGLLAVVALGAATALV